MANKIITTVGRVAAGLAALSLVAAATTASADSRRYRHHDGRNGDVAAAAIAAGVLGLAVGAAISSDNDHRDRRYYDDRYDRRYYAPPPPRYGYGYGYAPRPYRGDRECWTTREYDRWNGTYYERTVCR